MSSMLLTGIILSEKLTIYFCAGVSLNIHFIWQSWFVMSPVCTSVLVNCTADTIIGRVLKLMHEIEHFYGYKNHTYNGNILIIIKQQWKMLKGRKEMFYLMMHSTHFIYGYMTSDIW